MYIIPTNQHNETPLLGRTIVTIVTDPPCHFLTRRDRPRRPQGHREGCGGLDVGHGLVPGNGTPRTAARRRIVGRSTPLTAAASQRLFFHGRRDTGQTHATVFGTADGATLLDRRSRRALEDFLVDKVSHGRPAAIDAGQGRRRRFDLVVLFGVHGQPIVGETNRVVAVGLDRPIVEIVGDKLDGGFGRAFAQRRRRVVHRVLVVVVGGGVAITEEFDMMGQAEAGERNRVVGVRLHIPARILGARRDGSGQNVHAGDLNGGHGGGWENVVRCQVVVIVIVRGDTVVIVKDGCVIHVVVVTIVVVSVLFQLLLWD